MENRVTKPNGKIPVIRASKEDIARAFGLIAGLQEIKKAENEIERRFRAVPNGWRNIRMLETVYSNLIDDVLMTYPLEKLISMERMMPHMKYKVTCGVVASKLHDDECIITDENMNNLCIFAHEQCKMCIDQDCKRCKLGKTLDSVLCYDRDDSSWSNIDLEGMINNVRNS